MTKLNEFEDKIYSSHADITNSKNKFPQAKLKTRNCRYDNNLNKIIKID